MSAPRRFLFLSLVLLARLSSAAAIGVKGFAFSGVSNRFITPNGDGRNDNVAFNFSNPNDSGGTVKIYDVRGHLVTTLAINAGTGATSVIWDARVGGRVVPTGVYIFVIAVDSVVASGALVVIR